MRAIEIKLSQGAKPGLGGMLPGAKVSQEIAEIRGIPPGEDCASPSRHHGLHDVDSMLDFVELVAAETGLPVGIKSAVGDLEFWDELVSRWMGAGPAAAASTSSTSTAARAAPAPRRWSSPTRSPSRSGSASRRSTAGSPRRGSPTTSSSSAAGKLGLPENAVVAFALGVDMVNVGREAMMAIGCIQAQKCHTDHCPTGVATQNPWLVRGLDPDSKSRAGAQLRRSPCAATCSRSPRRWASCTPA